MIFENLFNKPAITSATLKVIVRNKTKLLYQKESRSVSMKNELGPFDILPEHENFISSTTGIITIVSAKGETWTTQHQTGIIKVTKDQVEIAILDI